MKSRCIRYPTFFFPPHRVTLNGGLARRIVEYCQFTEDGRGPEAAHTLARLYHIVVALGGNIDLRALVMLVNDVAVLLVAGRRHRIDDHLLALLVHQVVQEVVALDGIEYEIAGAAGRCRKGVD